MTRGMAEETNQNQPSRRRIGAGFFRESRAVMDAEQARRRDDAHQ